MEFSPFSPRPIPLHLAAVLAAGKIVAPLVTCFASEDDGEIKEIPPLRGSRRFSLYLLFFFPSSLFSSSLSLSRSSALSAVRAVKNLHSHGRLCLSSGRGQSSAVAASKFSITTVFLSASCRFGFSARPFPRPSSSLPSPPPSALATPRALAPPRPGWMDGEMRFRVSPSTGLDDFF